MRGKGIFIIFLAMLVSIYSTEALGLSFLAFVLCFFAVFLFVQKVFFKKEIGFFVVCMMAMVLVSLYTYSVLDIRDSALYKYSDSSCRIYGEIVEVCEENDDYARYVLKIDKIANKYGKNQEEVSEKVNFWASGKERKNLKYGDYICSIAEIEQISDKQNRNEFDYKLYNYSENIYFATYADAKDIKIYSHFDKVRNIYDVANIVREYIKTVAEKNLKSENAALLIGVLMSDKRGISDGTYEKIQTSGTAHIFVASGFHVSCIIYVIMMIMAVMHIPRKYLLVFMVPTLVLFIFVNGCSASVIRASVMATLCAAAKLMKRDDDLLINSAVAGIIILLINPISAFDLGFVLSFSAIYAIMFFNKKLFDALSSAFPLSFKKSNQFKMRIKKNFRYILSVISICVSVSIVTVPLCAYLFGYASLYGILANILLSWILPYALLASFLMIAFSLAGFLGEAFAFVVDIIFDYIYAVVSFIASLPFSSVEVYINLSIVIACITLAVGVYYYFNKKKKIACVALVFCGILVLGNVMSYANEFKQTKVCFVNVGQGDGCFIKFKGNEAVVIDAGGKYFSDKDNTFVPYMKRSGIKKIRYVFVSHFDVDHAKNILAVLDNFDVSNIVLPIRGRASKYQKLIESKALEKNINILSVCDEDNINISSDISVRIYAPPKNFVRFENENEGSMAMLFKIYESKFLFLGDLSENVQTRMASKYKDDLKCDVVKISHHGDFDSYSRVLMKYAEADYAVISSGDKKIYGHPDRETVSSLRKKNASVLCTNELGDIVFTVGKNFLEYDSFLSKKAID